VARVKAALVGMPARKPVWIQRIRAAAPRLLQIAPNARIISLDQQKIAHQNVLLMANIAQTIANINIMCLANATIMIAMMLVLIRREIL
jgi:hypothetical protein